MDQTKLALALDQLDRELLRRSLKLTIVICGAYAIHLHGFNRGIYTQDVDSLTKLESPEIMEIIGQVGKSLGIGPRWLNDQASSVPIPQGALERAKPLSRWRAIQASLLERIDLVKMKASAFSIRREETLKDWEDLKLLSPSPEEIEAAIDFLRETNSPPDSSRKIQDEFEETINDLKRLIK
jgi:hypothetical protein